MRSRELKSDLAVLWQLRHSIAHTAGWLTQPDAQKVERLRQRVAIKGSHSRTRSLPPWGESFTPSLSATDGNLLQGATSALGQSPSPDVVADFGAFFKVQSPKPTWL